MAETYDYYENVESDVYDVLSENADIVRDCANFNDFCTTFMERLIDSDDVTGNPSGSYFCNTWKAEEALSHNTCLINTVLQEMDYNINEVCSAETLDVIIRCYVLDCLFCEDDFLGKLRKMYNKIKEENEEAKDEI